MGWIGPLDDAMRGYKAGDRCAMLEFGRCEEELQNGKRLFKNQYCIIAPYFLQTIVASLYILVKNHCENESSTQFILLCHPAPTKC